MSRIVSHGNGREEGAASRPIRPAGANTVNRATGMAILAFALPEYLP